ncbi:MAG: sulfite exporter TauE/SafE family protein [Verrucomicrobia bacterium]|nr:MAG: sulfite exporter TauE/SafE family protein [Verrucomicrobiota bacterium]
MLDSPWTFALACFCACLIGLSKSGFTGLSWIYIIAFAEIYGAKQSVGLILPLLIAADCMAYPAFRQHGSWRPVWALIGPACVGVLLGWASLAYISDEIARSLIAACVLLMVVIHLARRWQFLPWDRWLESSGFQFGSGLFGGFASMLANAAGPIIQLYLLAKRLPKMELLGISARFFLLLNLIKLPISVRLDMIHTASLLENLKLLPFLLLGVVCGKWLIQKVPQRAFEWMLLVFAILAAARMLFS